jgi:NADPH:quinone reductase-like Zn-dependent oxidoreductase
MNRVATYSRYGSPEVVSISSQPIPSVDDRRLLIRVAAAGVNPLDWKLLRGDLRWIRRGPWPRLLGCDFAGVIEAVGRAVPDWREGQVVFGSLGDPLSGRRGSYAEWVTVDPAELVELPAGVSPALGAALPVAGASALQCLKLAEVRPGSEILIIGATGGIGSFATALAAAQGACVTAVCREQNEAYARQLGAARVIAYDRVDPLAGTARYDAILDLAGAHDFGAVRAAPQAAGQLRALDAGRGRFPRRLALPARRRPARPSIDGAGGSADPRPTGRACRRRNLRSGRPGVVRPDRGPEGAGILAGRRGARQAPARSGGQLILLIAMFIGHFAVGLGLKRVAPEVSLGTLFLGAQFIDLLWPTLLLTGTERVELAPGAHGPPLNFTHYPYSHSLLMVVVWAVLIGGAYYGMRRRFRGALVCAAAVLSHWILDLIVHHPDLPLAPGAEQHVGFGLWESLPASLALELGLFAVGCWMYCRATEAADRVGAIGFQVLLGFLVVIQLGNAFGDPPPSVAAVAWVGQAQWLLVLWAYWVDRHRRVREMRAEISQV